MITDFHEAYQQASRQFVASGNQNRIGVRGTPVVSIWPMKEKWKKFGRWFTTIGTDGDVTMHEAWFCHMDRTFDMRRFAEEPLMLQLYYKVLGDGNVVQLAWIRPDLDFRSNRIIKSERLADIHL